MSGASLELRGPGDGLVDDPLGLRLRGAGPAGGAAGTVWRARLRDDDGRVWRASAPDADALAEHWAPAKAGGGGPLAALASLRPVAVDVRAELPDGRAAARTVTRRFLAEGTRVRRWRAPVDGSLLLPAEPPRATVLLDATGAQGAGPAGLLAGALLASRGVAAVVLPPAARSLEARIDAAREFLAAVPGAAADAPVLPVGGPAGAPADDGVGVPPGIGVRDEAPTQARARADAWDALLARLGADPRRRED